MLHCRMLHLVFLGSLFITTDSADIADSLHILCDGSENAARVTQPNNGCDSTECKFSSDSLQKPNCRLSVNVTIDAEPHSCRSSHENISLTRYPSAPAELNISYFNYQIGYQCKKKTALNISWTAPNDGTQHLLTGFLLQIAHEEVDSVRITNRVFTLSGVDASTNMRMYYDCYIVNTMAAYNVTVYSLPRSRNDTNSLHGYIERDGPEQNAYCWKTLISLTAVPQNASVVVKYKSAPKNVSEVGTYRYSDIVGYHAELKLPGSSRYNNSTGHQTVTNDTICEVFSYSHATQDKCVEFVVRIFLHKKGCRFDVGCFLIAELRTKIFWSNSSTYDDGNLCDIRTTNRYHLSTRTSLILVTVDSASAITDVDDSQPSSAATVSIVVLIVVVSALIVVVVVYVSRRSTRRNPTCRLTAVGLHRLLLLDVSDRAASTKQPGNLVEQLALLLETRCQCDVTRFQDDVIRNVLTSSKSIRRRLASFAVIVIVHTAAARRHYDSRSNGNSGQPVDLYGRLLQHVMTLSSAHVYHVVFRPLLSTIICDDVSVRDEQFEAVDSVYELWEDTERLLDSIQGSVLPVLSDDEMKFIKLTCDELNDDYDRD